MRKTKTTNCSWNDTIAKLTDISERVRRDSELLHDYALVNGGTKKECKTCAYSATIGIARYVPVCWSCERFPLARPDAYADSVMDNWRYDGGKP